MNKSELLSKAKPILFNTPMVQAILDDRKTKTRRIVKEKALSKFNFDSTGKLLGSFDGYDIYPSTDDAPYHFGDILYVRETWYAENDLFSMQFPKYYYKADYSEADLDLKNHNADVDGEICSDFPACIKWRPSIHMPKEAARIFLRVTDVSVERLQDIVTGDYKTPLNINAEGLYEPCCRCTHVNGDCKDFIAQNNCRLLTEFKELWDSTIKKTDLDRYGWNANPWVWVIEFERLE